MESIKTINELMAQHFPEQEYIVNNLVPGSSITILSGDSRSYKTYVLLELAVSVACGKPLFSQFETTPMPVLIIDEENGERLLQKRFKQLGADPTLPIYFSSLTGFNVSDKTLDSVIESCKELGVGLVIIDSLIRIHDSDENSARDISKVFKGLRKFTKADISLLITQHNRKQGANYGGAGSEMRGSTDIMASIDSHIGISRKNKFYLRFDPTKQRFGLELDPFEVKVSANDSSFAFEYLGTSRKPSDSVERLWKAIEGLLNAHGKLSQKELLEMLDEAGTSTNEHEVRRLLARWVAEGLLPPPLKGKGTTKLYSLAGSDING